MPAWFLGLVVTRVCIRGIGAWGPGFVDWPSLRSGLQTESWQEQAKLAPNVIPARERRRAPVSVKMAVEVLNQAAIAADIDTKSTPLVFSSAMGDMEITDWLCRTLADNPALVSPTRFHNSVHNAPAGYWSIAAGSHAEATAVSAGVYTAPMALLEAVVQVTGRDGPVLLVMQETAATSVLRAACPSPQAFAVALVLAPCRESYGFAPVLEISPQAGDASWPAGSSSLNQSLEGNPAARMLPLLEWLAGVVDQADGNSQFLFPSGPQSALSVSAARGTG